MNRHKCTVFSEGKISNLVLKNRLVRSATCENSMTTDGKTTDTILKIYKDLAAGGSGLIITGLMAVSPGSKILDKQACIYSDEHITEIAKIADIVHQTDGRCVIIAQLCHPGRQILHKHDSAECVGPSAVESPILLKKARELSLDEIETIIKCFADAIVRVKKAGFDGAQLHAAHGYLLSSFLSPYTNQRTDRFGGSVKNRVNIIRDIISLASKEVGDFPILIKINCDDHVDGGISQDDFTELITEIEDTGVDAIEVSGAMWDCLARSEKELGFVPLPLPEARTRINTAEKQSYYYDSVKNIDSYLPLILVGGHRNIERMESILNAGKVDFLSLCRPLISEPDLPNRWLDGAGNDYADCASCNACFVMQEEFGCALKKNGRKKEMFDMFAQGWKDIFK
ncbi:NADH oxidase [Sporomusa silvacetica DSM 10669]|uniref:NADH oxidase n=1 Tax=Sporomusa silvacetica DSM 10669 TaxID=1123289 RepID=A0ABZ3IR65_9FIRM|nr:NADH:flavin oxidoreductase [Sporomusa silvacetica]OZC20688.1 NADH oxidase [Sporomusa silvacetica DSM 10669]